MPGSKERGQLELFVSGSLRQSSWRQARAETAGTTVNVAGLTIAVLQLETSPRRRATAPQGSMARIFSPP